ncbi:hypothetical protein JL722_1395 [Aureococcus anophagefferens]|nr:hypothetical protein JL722_1395 [Aureococcus anophagefferens]
MHEEQKEMDTARLPNPRDAIEQWLRGAGVPRSTASSSASLLAERNWQPAGASGALSDMRGLPDEAVLLAQRRLGRESVYREFLEGARRRGRVDAGARALRAPRREAAERHRAGLLFEGGENSVRARRSASSAGVELFFRALRVSFWAMCAMALCYGPALAIHRAGNDGYALSTPKIVAAGDLGFVRYGLGNEGLDRDAISSRRAAATARRCRRRSSTPSAASTAAASTAPAATRASTRVAYALAGSALAASIVLVVAAFYFDRTLGKVVARRRTIQAEPADYTIIVKGLPPTATIASVREHFSSLYDLKGPAYRHAPVAGVDAGGVRLHGAALATALAAAATHFVVLPYASSKIPRADELGGGYKRRAALVGGGALLVAQPPFGNLIRRARKMLKVDEKAETLNALLARERSDRARPGRIARLERKIAKTRKRFERSATKLRKRYAPERTMRPCGRVAFVTFEHEESCFRCLDDYRASWSWYRRRFQRALRFPDGETKRRRLIVKRAPAPSNVVWENLEQSWGSRVRRAAAARAVTLALLAASALAINKAAVAARDAVESIPDSLQCRALEAAVVGTFNSTLRELRYNETVDCGGDAFHLAYDGLDYDQLPPLELDAYGDISPLPRATRASTSSGTSDDKHAHALFPCGANATCDTLAVTCAAPRCGVCDDPCAPGDRSRDNEDGVCYTLPCYGRSESGAPGWIDDPGYSCFEYHPSLLAACFCRFNLGAKKAALLAGRRKPAEAAVCAKTLRNVMVAFLLKIAVALLVVLVNELIVNTALLALAINASLKRDESPDGVDEGADRTNLLGGSHRSMGKAWYATVGASLTLTMLTNVVVPQISFVQKVVVKELKRTALRSWVKTQSALDRLYTPTPWQIERSYAIALTTLFVTTLYAPGLPQRPAAVTMFERF